MEADKKKKNKQGEEQDSDAVQIEITLNEDGADSGESVPTATIEASQESYEDLFEEALKKHDEREGKKKKEKKVPQRKIEDLENRMVEMRKDFHLKLMEADKTLKEKEAEIEAINDRLLRLGADFDNFRKRDQKEKSDRFNYGNEEIAKEILPVVDNLERAIATIEKEGEVDDPTVQGVELTLKSLENMLSKFNIKPIEALNTKFDPTYHQAIAQVEVEEDRNGLVVEEHSKGYMLLDRLLRPSMVVVGKSVKPAAASDNEAQDEAGEEAAASNDGEDS